MDNTAAALGKIASGLFIVSCRKGENTLAYLGSWVQQASFSPLLITVALKSDRICYQPIFEGKKFCLNILGKNYLSRYRAFWDPDNLNPLESIAHKVTDYGADLDSSLAILNCQLVGAHETGDHTLLIAEVQRSEVKIKGTPAVHFRTSGKDY